MTVNMKRRTRQDTKLGATYRVVADGRDLTNQTFYVDGRRRIVGIYKRDADGKLMMTSDHRIAETWLHPRRVRLIKRTGGAR